MPFLGDMLVPWRVGFNSFWFIVEFVVFVGFLLSVQGGHQKPAISSYDRGYN